MALHSFQITFTICCCCLVLILGKTDSFTLIFQTFQEIKVTSPEIGAVSAGPKTLNLLIYPLSCTP